ncbi:uncharacterized protein LOC132723232 isoform X2 [Ruditapes philippinarum]|uniref:uncharacterized protein LOC132723232 isoform X2 n=1 Tax=Ruditapes philippinarum TaxID=129788 RepID=UPI00295B74F4|nr:uncharacterized protein LOC132723232 isoform X2 [Ruditapes philippinarum]
MYSALCKLSLAEVILFNRKRSGEAERLKKEDFLKGCVNENVDKDVSKTLSKFERQLCRSHFRVETRGKSLKRGRRVSILFTKNMKENLDILLKLQSRLHIESDYVFIRPGGRKPFRGNDVLKEAAETANVTHASRITSTSLRKQLATMSQVLNLTESNQDLLATFMGHDIRIHREYYRLPEGTLEVAKVCKILHLLNTGKITETEAAKIHDNTQSFIDKETTVTDEENSSDEDDEQSDGQCDGAEPSRLSVVSPPRSEPTVKPRYGLQNTGDFDSDDDVGDPDWVNNKRQYDSDESDDDLKTRKKQKKNCGKKLNYIC